MAVTTVWPAAARDCRLATTRSACSKRPEDDGDGDSDGVIVTISSRHHSPHPPKAHRAAQ